MTSPQSYQYDHLRRHVLMEDMSFGDQAPRPGERIPRFELPLADGGRFDSHDAGRRKPLLIVTGSLSCPMTASSNPLVKEMAEEFGQDVDFLMLMVREAHPGEDLEQADSLERKRELARRLRARDDLPFPIAVDDTDGSVHRMFDNKPNAVWLTDADGTIIYRALWAGDDGGLVQALDAAVRGTLPARQDSSSRLGPMAMGIGKMGEMTGRSGSRAKRDLWRSAPPMAAIATVADLYRPLPPKWRTAAAVGTIALAIAALVRAASSRRRQD